MNAIRLSLCCFSFANCGVGPLFFRSISRLLVLRKMTRNMIGREGKGDLAYQRVNYESNSQRLEQTANYKLAKYQLTVLKMPLPVL